MPERQTRHIADILQTFELSILPDLLSGIVEAFLKVMKYFVIVPLRFPNALCFGPLKGPLTQKNNLNLPDLSNQEAKA
jgi:hypothetical protein